MTTLPDCDALCLVPLSRTRTFRTSRKRSSPTSFRKVRFTEWERGESSRSSCWSSSLSAADALALRALSSSEAANRTFDARRSSLLWYAAARPRRRAKSLPGVSRFTGCRPTSSAFAALTVTAFNSRAWRKVPGPYATGSTTSRTRSKSSGTIRIGVADRATTRSADREQRRASSLRSVSPPRPIVWCTSSMTRRSSDGADSRASRIASARPLFASMDTTT